MNLAAALDPAKLDALLTHMLLFLPRLGTALLLGLLAWLAAGLVRRLIGRVGERRRVNPDAVSLLGDVSYLALLACGLVTALGTVGVNVAAMVGALGLTGFALGFAFKDAISNLLAGILVLIYEPFRRGDEIMVAGRKGVVHEINLRYTMLQGASEAYLVPNATLFTEVITVGAKTQPKPAPPPPPSLLGPRPGEVQAPPL